MNTRDLMKSAQNASRQHRRSRADAPFLDYFVASRRATDERNRGGDVVDILLHADGSCSILVADVSSKGAPSADHVSSLRDAFRRSAGATNSPSHIMADLSTLRFETNPRSMCVVFATAFVANINRSHQYLRYASAGHVPALLIAGKIHRHLNTTGPLLGVLSKPIHDECIEPFESTSQLVIATDGFCECRNLALDSMQFGTAGIVRALAFDKARSSRSAAEIVARSADIFTGGRYLDDATVAVVTRNV
jgi:sigma-B regulation protein RsbU (phosphoserine phosphatase)